jgi:pSer/pThr/pTyr-binding forkhead associated (FHA) protein
MAMVLLTFNAHVLKEVPLDQPQTWIGRKPHNAIVIDNPAVSGEHARIVHENGGYVIEDMCSTNGTFVNDKKVDRHQLQDGDQVRIGKHVLVYQDGDAATGLPTVFQPGAGAYDPNKTMILDTAKQRELLKGEQAGAEAERASEPMGLGLLRVMAGKTDQKEYRLTGRLTIIGNQNTATVRLTGWFAPKVAALISRRPEGYVIGMSEAGIAIRLNGARIQDRRELRGGDFIEVAGVRMVFSLVDPHKKFHN